MLEKTLLDCDSTALGVPTHFDQKRLIRIVLPCEWLCVARRMAWLERWPHKNRREPLTRGVRCCVLGWSLCAVRSRSASPRAQTKLHEPRTSTVYYVHLGGHFCDVSAADVPPADGRPPSNILLLVLRALSWDSAPTCRVPVRRPHRGSPHSPCNHATTPARDSAD